MTMHEKKGRMLICLLLLPALFFAQGGREAPQSGEEMVINWMPQNDQPVDPESPVVKMFEERFGCRLNFIYLDRSKEKELLNLRIASGEIPDVMRVNDDVYRQYIAQDVLARIPEELIREKAPSLYEITRRNGGDYAWEFAKEGDQVYGLPYLNLDGKYHFVNIWRTDWLEKVGIAEVPETLEEAEEAFYRFVRNDPDGNGKQDSYALSDKGFGSVFGAFGGVPYFSQGGGNTYTWSLREGKVVLTAVLPEMKEALAVLHRWYRDGLIDPEFFTGENKGQYWGKSLSFWNDRIGFSCPGKHYHVAPPVDEGKPGSPNYIGFTDLHPESPLYSVGKPLVGPRGEFGAESWGTFPGIYVVMGKQVEEDPAKMAKILEINEALVKDYDLYILSRFGIEGIHHEVNDEGLYLYKEAFRKNEQRARAGLENSGIGYLGTNNFDFITRSTGNKYPYAEEVSHYTDNYKNLVWAGLPSDIRYKATIYKKIMENYFLFISGDRPLEEFDLFVDELNNAGLKTLTEEANHWYAKFRR